MTTAISICTIILLLVITAAVITVTIYLVKWLISFTQFTNSLNETTQMLKSEVSPILGEVKETLQNINELSKNANNQVLVIKKIISTILGLGSIFTGKFKFLSGSFLKGFQAAFNFFRKK